MNKLGMIKVDDGWQKLLPNHKFVFQSGENFIVLVFFSHQILMLFSFGQILS